MAKSRVAAIKCKPETILADLERVCGLAGMERALRSGATTLLKDDVSWHYPFPAANTTPWQLEGAILALKKGGFDRLSCVESEGRVRSVLKGEDLNHYAPLLDKYGVSTLSPSRGTDMRLVEYRPRARMHVLNKLFPEGIRVPDTFFGKNVVHLPTMKCHVFTTTSGALQNGFVGLLGGGRHRAHPSIHRALVDALAIQKEIHSGLFAIMDGTTAGNGPGPRTMIPVVKDYVLASDDQVAIDAVAAKMMGFDPLAIECIKVAHDDKLGVGDPRDIEIVGDDVSRESWGFRVGDNGASFASDLLGFGPMKRLQKLFFGTPLVNAFVLGSEAYHDFYRWPLQDRQTFEGWKAGTAWGKLFAAYERGEADRVTRRTGANGIREPAASTSPAATA